MTPQVPGYIHSVLPDTSIYFLYSPQAFICIQDTQQHIQAGIPASLLTPGQVTVCLASGETVQSKNNFDLCLSLTVFLDLCINAAGYTRY